MLMTSFYSDRTHDFKRDNLIELRQMMMRLNAIATSEGFAFVYVTAKGVTAHIGKDAEGNPLCMTVLAEDIDKALEGDHDVTQ